MAHETCPTLSKKDGGRSSVAFPSQLGGDDSDANSRNYGKLLRTNR